VPEPTRGTKSRRPERSSPLRTCVGCGRKAPKAELFRFVVQDGTVAASATKPGRGAYTCRRLACFERAAAKNAFNRAFRRTVLVDPELVRLYTDA
jgi:uncharacterized protein